MKYRGEEPSISPHWAWTLLAILIVIAAMALLLKGDIMCGTVGLMVGMAGLV